MDWAKNSAGDIIAAKREAYVRYENLVCPECAAPVDLRSGSERRPYFAHRKNRAQPECELYYPPQEVLHQISKRASPKEPILFPQRDSLRCGLFLSCRPEPVGFGLFMRIPSLAFVEKLKGSLEIQHKTGVKTFDATQLTRTYTFPLRPTVPLIECDGNGDLSGLKEHLLAQTNSFCNGMNVFVATEGGGRFLFPLEPLEAGRRYWIISDVSVNPPDCVLEVIDWSRSGSLAEWYVYEMCLPSGFIASRMEASKKVITEFFGRSIRPRQPRAYISYPLPHHVADDGAYIYPETPDFLYIRRTLNHQVTIDGSPEIRKSARIITLSDDWVRIEGIRLAEEEVAVLINGVEQIVLRSEMCGLIQSPELYADTSEKKWSLLSNSPLSSKELFDKKIQVDCGNKRLAESVAKNNEELSIDSSVITLLENTDKTLKAGGWGEIRYAHFDSVENQDEEIINHRQGKLSPRVIWIEGLIQAKFGAHAASQVKKFIEIPTQKNLQKLGPILTSPYMAYIRESMKNT